MSNGDLLWIYRIAHNELVNALKKKKKDRETVSLFYVDVLFPHPIAKENANENTSRREIKEILEGSLDKLSPKYREPLVLYYLEDMDYKEVADILRIPVSTVASGCSVERCCFGSSLKKKASHNTMDNESLLGNKIIETLEVGGENAPAPVFYFA